MATPISLRLQPKPDYKYLSLPLLFLLFSSLRLFTSFPTRRLQGPRRYPGRLTGTSQRDIHTDTVGFVGALDDDCFWV